MDNESGLSLPFELLVEIINYVASKNRALFRFRLCSKRWMNQAISCLKHVRIDGYPKSDPSIFLGSKPQSVFVSILQDDKHEIEALGELLSCSTHFQLRAYKTLPVALTSLGPRLKSIKSLACSYDCSSVFRDFLLSWIPHLSQLEELRIGAHTVSLDAILESLSHNCTGLKSLFLDPNRRMPASLSNHLKTLTSLETLEIGITYQQIQDIQDIQALVAAQPSPDFSALGAAIERLRSYLPPQLRQDLGKVAVSIGSNAGKVPNIFAYSYVRSASERVADFWLEKMQQSNLSHDNSGWGAVLKFCLMHQPYNHIRLRKLLQSAVDIWTPAFVHGKLGVCNAFHVAAVYSSEAVMEELLSRVDWSTVTDLAPFRTSWGYTPLHIVSERFDTWKKLYYALKQRFPGVARDTINGLNASPLLALHKRSLCFGSSSDMPLMASELMLVCDNKLLADPQLIDPSCSLFPTVFKFYSSRWKSVESRLKSGKLLRRLLEHHSLRVGVSHVSQIDHRSLKIKKDSLSVQLAQLNFTLLLDEDLIAVLSRACDKAALSECLISFAFREEPKSWSLQKKFEKLIQCGADCTYASRLFLAPFLPSYIMRYIPTRRNISWSPELHSNDAESKDAQAWRIFWSILWLLVDHGAKLDNSPPRFVNAEFGPRISLCFSHPLNDVIRICQFAPAACPAVLSNLKQACSVDVQSQFYYDALFRTLFRRLGQPVPATAPTEEHDLAILSRWSPEEGPPKR